MRPGLVALAAAALVAGAAAPSYAQKSKAKLFQLTAQGLPSALKDAPEELTAVLAKELAADTMPYPIEDAATILGCKLAQRECLEQIAGEVQARTILFGRIEKRGDGAVIKLTAFDTKTGESERSFLLEGDTPDALADALRERLDEASRPRKPPKRTPVDDKPDPPDQPDDPPEVLPEVPDEDRPAGKVTGGTWAMVIGGGAGVGAGLVLLVAGAGLSNDIQQQPTETREDIDRLLQLERAQRLRYQLGGGLLLAGGIVTTIGVVRLIKQRRSAPEPSVIDVVPEKGGASVLFTMRFR